MTHPYHYHKIWKLYFVFAALFMVVLNATILLSPDNDAKPFVFAICFLITMILVSYIFLAYTKPKESADDVVVPLENNEQTKEWYKNTFDIAYTGDFVSRYMAGRVNHTSYKIPKVTHQFEGDNYIETTETALTIEGKPRIAIDAYIRHGTPILIYRV